MNSKKEKERKAVNQFYKENSVEIINYEKPDFIIKTNDETFGVEVTDYYYNESSARIKNFKGYTEKILNSNDDSVLDKRDIDKITKLRLYVYNKQKKENIFVNDFVGLKYKQNYEININPDFNFIEKQFIDIINKKSDKIVKKQNIDYYELFIQDKENYIFKYMNNIIYSKKILLTIVKSNFKRVYIFSNKKLCIIGENPKEKLMEYKTGDGLND